MMRKKNNRELDAGIKEITNTNCNTRSQDRQAGRMTQKLKELIRARTTAFDKYNALNYALVACALDSAAVCTLLNHFTEITDVDERDDFEQSIIEILEGRGVPGEIANNLFCQFDEARQMLRSADEALEAEEEYRAFGGWDNARNALSVEDFIELTEDAKSARRG